MAVVEFVIVGAGDGVFMPLKLCLPAEERKDRLHVIVHVRLGERRPVAAVVCGVVLP